MSRKRLLAHVILVGLIMMPPAAARADHYTIPDSKILKIYSKNTGADYELFTYMPHADKKPTKPYPVVFMLDADYSFAIVRNIVHHFIERGNLPNMILVAVAYPGAAQDPKIYRKSRTRDYTPTFVAEGGYGLEFQKYSGGGPKFMEFFSSELIPFIEKHFPNAAHDDRTIIGHSYGGLFGATTLLMRPELFQRYIIVSPSLWYDNNVVMQYEAAQAKSSTRIKAHVFLGVGALEDPSMSSDLLTLRTRLLERQDPGLVIDCQIFDDETHNSVFPGAVTRGLLKVFDAFPALAPNPRLPSTNAPFRKPEPR